MIYIISFNLIKVNKLYNKKKNSKNMNLYYFLQSIQILYLYIIINITFK